MPNDIEHEFVAALRQKAKLDEILNGVQPQNADESEYASIAESMHEVVTKLRLHLNNQGGDGHSPVIFIARMEEALCRLLTRNSAQLTRAITLYKGIQADFPNRPTCPFRLGQACAERAFEMATGSNDQEALANSATDAYALARKQLKALDGKSEAERRLVISSNQEKYLRENLARIHSFLLWRLSDLRRLHGEPNEKDFVDVSAALKIANASLISDEASGDARLALLNNVAWYALDVIEIAEKLGVSRKRLPSNGRLSELVNELARESATKNVTDIKRWHTIFRGYLRLNQQAAAYGVASRIVDLFMEVDAENQAPYDLDVNKRAAREAHQFVRAWSA